MEKWKDVVGFEGLYEVSDYGNVKSLDYNKTGETRLLKPAKCGDGYLRVGLCKDGERKLKRVHRLVAEAFLPNPLNLPEVNHKSECPMLNFACVLEWTTHKENINYGTHNQRVADSHSISIDQFTLDGVFVRRWKSAHEASRQLGIRQGNIWSCLLGIDRRKTAGGFIWKYPPTVETNI